METDLSTPPAPAAELPESPARRYDVFVSYAHAADNVLAPALRLGLERLTKPWYRRLTPLRPRSKVPRSRLFDHRGSATYGSR